MRPDRFFLSRDNSGHWYIIPVVHRADWSLWCDLLEDDEASWTIPSYAHEIGGHPSRVEFECWTTT